MSRFTLQFERIVLKLLVWTSGGLLFLANRSMFRKRQQFIIKSMNEAVDIVRRIENKELLKLNIKTLTGTKYIWLKKPVNFTEKNRKELLKHLWDYYEGSARKYFKKWYFSATHSRLKPIIDVAMMFKRHIENILTYVKHRFSNAYAEGINSVIQHIKATARGFRNYDNYRTSILFYCLKLNLYP